MADAPLEHRIGCTLQYLSQRGRRSLAEAGPAAMRRRESRSIIAVDYRGFSVCPAGLPVEVGKNLSSGAVRPVGSSGLWRRTPLFMGEPVAISHRLECPHHLNSHLIRLQLQALWHAQKEGKKISQRSADARHTHPGHCISGQLIMPYLGAGPER